MNETDARTQPYPKECGLGNPVPTPEEKGEAMNIPVFDFKLPTCARHNLPMVAHCSLCDAENAAPDPATELIRELRDALRLSLAGQQGFIIEPNALLARADAYLREHGAEQAGKEDEA